ncbi:MAG TPA: DNA-directed RNA polymerase subunit omega [Candidatus Eubacterium faecavium]|nr:DNA-directed RNA polymerase subunit omega [Candidatus Eubacterium faecavium]
MFNPDLKKLLKDCNSRYSLVVGVAKRAREIRDEANNNEVLLDEKSVSTAINDIYDGKFVVEEPEEIKAQNHGAEERNNVVEKNTAIEEPADETESSEQ